MQQYSGGINLVLILAGMFVMIPAPKIKHSMSEFDNWIPFPYVPNPPDFNPHDYTFENVKFKLYAGTYNYLCYFTDWEHGTAEGNELAGPNGFHIYRKVHWSESNCPRTDEWSTTDPLDEETPDDEGATTNYMSEDRDDGDISTVYSTTEAPPTTDTTSEMTESVTKTEPADLPAQFARLVKCFRNKAWLFALETEEFCSDPMVERYSLNVCVVINPGRCQLVDHYIGYGRKDISKLPSPFEIFFADEENSCGATLQLLSFVDSARDVNYTSEEIQGYTPTGFWVWEAKYCDA